MTTPRLTLNADTTAKDIMSYIEQISGELYTEDELAAIKYKLSQKVFTSKELPYEVKYECFAGDNMEVFNWNLGTGNWPGEAGYRWAWTKMRKKNLFSLIQLHGIIGFDVEMTGALAEDVFFILKNPALDTEVLEAIVKEMSEYNGFGWGKAEEFFNEVPSRLITHGLLQQMLQPSDTSEFTPEFICKLARKTYPEFEDWLDGWIINFLLTGTRAAS